MISTEQSCFKTVAWVTCPERGRVGQTHDKHSADLPLNSARSPSGQTRQLPFLVRDYRQRRRLVFGFVLRALGVSAVNKAPVSQGSLWFSTVDEQGHWMETPVVGRKVLERLQLTGRIEPVSYRVQVLLTGYGPPAPAERDAARQLFEAARELLVPQLFGQMQRK